MILLNRILITIVLMLRLSSMSLLGIIGGVGAGISLLDKLTGASAKRQEASNMKMASYNDALTRKLTADLPSINKTGMKNAGISTAALGSGGSFQQASLSPAQSVDGSAFDIGQGVQSAVNSLLQARAIDADASNKDSEAALNDSKREYQDMANFFAEPTLQAQLDNLLKDGSIKQADYDSAMQQINYFNAVKDYRVRKEQNEADISDTQKEIANLERDRLQILNTLSEHERDLAKKNLDAFDKRFAKEMEKADAEIAELKSRKGLNDAQAQTEKFKRVQLAADAALKGVQADATVELTPKQSQLLQNQARSEVSKHNLLYYQAENQRIKNKYQDDLSALEVGDEFTDIVGKGKKALTRRGYKTYSKLKRRVKSSAAAGVRPISSLSSH
jgi:hypothetical protein